MSTYYIKLTREGKKYPRFLGPYENKDMAMGVVSSQINLEDVSATVLSKVKARADGLRSPEMGDYLNTLLGNHMPEKIMFDEISLDDLHKKGRKKGYMVKNKDSGITMPPRMVNYGKILIITDKSSVVEWLARNGIVGEIANYPHPDQIRGRSVIGVIPNRLEVLANRVGNIEMPGIAKRPDLKNISLSVDQMVELGAKLKWYKTFESED